MGDRAGSIPVIRITKSLEIEVFRGFLYEQIKLEKPMDLLPLASLIYLTVTIYYTINLNTSLLFFSILATIIECKSKFHFPVEFSLTLP